MYICTDEYTLYIQHMLNLYGTIHLWLLPYSDDLLRMKSARVAQFGP